MTDERAGPSPTGPATGGGVDAAVPALDLDRMLATRAERLDDYLDENDLEAVWFAAPNAFAWLTGGSNVVDRSAPVGVAAAGYTADGEFRCVTNNIEADRLVAEELPGRFSVDSEPWHEATLDVAVAANSPRPAAADFDVEGFDSIDASPLRQPLTDADVARYRALGRGAAAALESVCRDLDPSDTEAAAAARLRGALAARGIDAPVALVGGAERTPKYRHFTPKDVPLGDYAVASVTAHRGGLHASVTRTVAFDPPAWLAARHEASMAVEAAALGATRETAREGGTAGDVFEAIAAAYDRAGEPGEWREHHQGGAAGFAGREWFATPDAEAPVRAPMAYAYNPSVRGAKSEDTVLVTDAGFEVLTRTGEWPTRAVEDPATGARIERHDVLGPE